MKVMHYPPSDVRAKICKLLEKEGKELVHLSYGTENMDERRFYVGIAYTPINSEWWNGRPLNRYDVVTYDNETNNFEYYSSYLHYENALIHMGQCIRHKTYEN